jgi:hypothetical protein
LLLLIPSLVFANSQGKNSLPREQHEECLPLKPDLNNDGLVGFSDLWIVGHE